MKKTPEIESQVREGGLCVAVCIIEVDRRLDLRPGRDRLNGRSLVKVQNANGGSNGEIFHAQQGKSATFTALGGPACRGLGFPRCGIRNTRSAR